MRDKKNNNVLELLSVYNKQENRGDYFAYDDSNNNNGIVGDCCECGNACSSCSDCCGSGNACCDGLCGYVLCCT